jgi:hypothetical protein
MQARDYWTIGLIVVGMVFQAALAIDRWVHRQSYSSVDIEKELARLRELVLSSQERWAKNYEQANERWSKKMSGLQRWVGRMELELARLRARDEMRDRPH